MSSARIGRRGVATASLALALCGGRAMAAGPEARSMSLEDCVAMALTRNADVLSKEAEVSHAEAAAGGTEGKFGPKVHIDANFQQWNSPFDIPFGGQSF